MAAILNLILMNLPIFAFGTNFGAKLDNMKRMNVLIDSIYEYKRDHGSFPQDLSQFKNSRDSWGSPYKYQVTLNGFTLLSLGADKREGGNSKNMDIVFNYIDSDPETLRKTAHAAEE